MQSGKQDMTEKKSYKSPGLARKFLKWMSVYYKKHSIVEDFEETFAEILESEGSLKARSWYWGNALKSVLGYLKLLVCWKFTMLKNHLKIAYRNFVRHKLYSFINTFGLAVGFSCCLLILLYVQHELSYDAYHDKTERIYRLTLSGKIGDSEFEAAAVAAPTASALMQDYPEVKEATRLYTSTRKLNCILQYGDRSFKERRVAFADPNIFNVLSIPFVSGDPDSALAQPNSIVISDRMVEKYFIDEDPMGKTLTMDGIADYSVTGVYEAIPSNSHFHFDFMAALLTLEEAVDPYWLNNISFRTYLLLEEDSSAEALIAKFPGMVRKYIFTMMEQLYGQKFEQMLESGMYFEYGLQPLRSIHLHSNLHNEFEPNSDIRYVYVFSIVALFILILACINFMNLSTARALKRAKEVGIRKVTGSQRTNLIAQFLFESLVLSFTAAFLAVIFVGSFLPQFNQISGKNFTWSNLFDGGVLLSLAVLILIAGFLAGLYPAFSLSSFQPIAGLKQELTRGNKGRKLRHLLVVFQFTASIILIIGTLVVSKQIHYIQNKDLGFDQEQVLIVQDTYVLGDRIHAFKQQVLQIPDLMYGTITGFLPIESDRLVDVCQPEGIYREKGTPMQRWQVDYDYIKTMGMEIVEGRDFSRAFSTDAQAIIVNEAAVKHFGWKQAIGKHVGDYSEPPELRLIDWPVIGVVKDFHFDSLRSEVGPLILQLSESTNLMALRFKTQNLTDLIDKIRSIWKQFTPHYPFEFTFMDEEFNAMYKAEQQIGKIIGMFAILAIFIGTLGMFGLAAFTAEQKTREIGVRKVLGSSASSIVMLLSKDFLRWVVIANLIAWPMAFMLMDRWLRGFAYRTNLSLLTFLVAGLFAIFIAMCTVIFQSIKAAMVNPVESLKHE